MSAPGRQGAVEFSARRALGRGDLRSVYRSGSRHATAVATVHVLRHTQPGFRIAVPVARRIGSAVVRNKVRRRLREAFRELQREARSGGDIVIVARPAATTMDFQAMVGHLRRAMKESGLIASLVTIITRLNTSNW